MNIDTEGPSKHKRWSDVTKTAGKIARSASFKERPSSKYPQTGHLCENPRTKGEAEVPFGSQIKKKEKRYI